MTREQMVALSGFELFQKQIKALRQNKITWRHLCLTSQVWLLHHGYMPTSLGWWKLADLEAMGAVQDAAGDYAIGAEERRRIIGRGGEQVTQVFAVVQQATHFLAARQQQNRKFAGLVTAAPPHRTPIKDRKAIKEGGAASSALPDQKAGDLVAYARELFSEENKFSEE